MTRTPAEALAALHQMAADGRLDRFCAEHGVTLLVAFGSAVEHRAGRTDTAPNDLDLAASGDFDIVGLTSALIGLLACNQVDVMDLDRAGIAARAGALHQGQPLFEAERGHFSREAMRALGMAADTAWIRELQLQQLRS